MRAIRTVIVVLVSAAALAGCGTAASDTPPATVTVTASAEEEGVTADEPKTSEATEPETTEPTPEAAAAAEETFEMPSLVGMNLQTAQDTLQSLDSWFLDQEDASGLGRMQMVDSNWQVCQQDPAAGTVVPISTVVTLWSVKLDEACA